MAWKYTKALHKADQKLSNERERFRNLLDEAQKRYEQLLKETMEVHLKQLNENAARTIEERGHFPSNEAFEPFRDQVMKFIQTHEGTAIGTNKTIEFLLKINSALLGIITVALAIYGFIK